MEEDISKIPTVDLITTATRLDQEIELLILKYNKLILELNKRFPQLENSDEFKKKVFKKEK